MDTPPPVLLINYIPRNSLEWDYPPSCAPSGYKLHVCITSSVSVHLLKE